MHFFLALVAIISLSTASVFVRLSAAPPEVIGFWRLLGAFLVLLPLVIYKKELRSIFKLSRQELFWTVGSGFFFFIHLWTFFYSAQNTKISNCMILFSTHPLFTALGAFLLFRKKLTWRWLGSYVLAFIGVIFILKEPVEFSTRQSGDWAGFLAAVFFSAYILSGRKVRESMNNTSYSLIIYAVVFLCFGVGVLVKGSSLWGYSPLTAYAILGTLIFPTLLGHALFTYVMKWMDINLLSCGKLAEPVLAIIYASAFFNEKITTQTLWAFLLTALAVSNLFLPEWWEKRRRKQGELKKI